MSGPLTGVKVLELAGIGPGPFCGMLLAEAPRHAHNQARGAFVAIDGVTQPAPAPRYSRTPGAVARGALMLDKSGGSA
jgi:crotonobetainyl-CoA:carnitine CoA-transferase CaiB-like acyl-CoA transferase